MNALKPKKTGQIINNPKEKYMFEPQQYEIDEKQIYDFYKIIPKKEPKYNVIKKQVAFCKDIAFKKIDNNKKFNNYCIFRDYMQKKIDIDDIKSDIEQVKSLINQSENIRNKFYSYFHIDRADIIKTNEYSKFINIRKKKPENNYPINSEALSNNDFLRKCIMLKRKREEDDNKEKSKTFTLFSDLDIKSNKFNAVNFLVNKNKLSEKYYEQKKKLIRCFNREERFINFNKLIKQSTIQETPDILEKNTKDKYSSNYFDLIYDKREESYYEKMDQFFAKYEITNYKLKNEDSDFYGKIYGILCKNNYLKFLSYLYSKNEIFKYIYDLFSDKDATGSDYSLEETSLVYDKYKSREKSMEENDEFFGDILKQKELGNNFQAKKKLNIGLGLRDIEKEGNKEENILVHDAKKDLFEQIMNNFAYIKLGFVNENIKLKYIKEFFEMQDNEEEEDNEDKNNKKNTKFYKYYLKKCAKESLNNILLITNKKKLIIMDPELNRIFEQKMSEITFIKINKDYLKSILKNKIKSIYPPEDIQTEYYLYQNKKENGKEEYYIFKISKRNAQLFDKQIPDNDFNYIKIKDFIDKLDVNNIKLKKENENEKESQKEKEKEENINKEIKEEDKDKGKEEKKENINIVENDNSKKSEKEEVKEEQLEEQFAKPSSFNKNEIESEKYSASILNDDEDDEMGNIIKIGNIKKTAEYQREHKNYEFEINNKKYFFDIYQGQLRCKINNSNMKTYELNEIFPEKVEEDRENSCYKMFILKGQKIIYKIYSQDKNNLDNFYNDIIKTKKQFNYD